MPNIYITDETKEILERASKLDQRTQDGEINFLCKQRVKELSAPSGKSPSVESASDTTSKGVESQEKITHFNNEGGNE